MKVEPEFQGQHRLSQVYLKQFGYKKDDIWMVSVYEAGKKTTSNIKIAEFTREINVFDLPFTEPELRRHFENTSNKVETRYPTVISNLQHQKRLTDIDKDIINHFVANMLCRTYPFRAFIDKLLHDAATRDKLIEEMTMFSEDTEETKALLDLFKGNSHLNLAVGTLMNHLVHVFSCFNKVIIRSHDQGWLTTDSPVFIDNQGHGEWIIPIETELFMPLSKDFCLFMYHSESELCSNPLRELKQDRVNSVDFDTFEGITKKIVFDYDKYLIFNCELKDTDVTK